MEDENIYIFDVLLSIADQWIPFTIGVPDMGKLQTIAEFYELEDKKHLLWAGWKTWGHAVRVKYEKEQKKKK